MALTQGRHKGGAVKPGLIALFSLALLAGWKSSDHIDPPLEDIPAKSGLDFWHYSGATGDFHLPEIMGSGAALIDYDHDGDLDIYLVQGAPDAPLPGMKPLVPPPPGWKSGNRLFRNNLIPSGKLSFTDVTEEAGVGYKGVGMG